MADGKTITSAKRTYRTRCAVIEPDLRAGTADRQELDKIVCRHSLYRLNASMMEQKKKRRRQKRRGVGGGKGVP